MAKLTRNFDFLAISALALILGVIQAPRLGSQAINFALEQRGNHIRTIQISHPVDLEICHR
jgi:hypothetical protein